MDGSQEVGLTVKCSRRDVDADVAQVDRDAVDDVGDRVGARGVDRDLGGLRVDVDGRADHDRAEVEGPDRRRVDRDDREGRAVEGTGEVEAARRRSRAPGRPRSRRPCGRSRWRPDRTGVPPLRSRPRAAPLRSPRRSSRGCRRFAEEPRRQHGRVGGDLLFGVGAGEVDVEGRVGACLGVDAARLRRGAKAGCRSGRPPSGPLVIGVGRERTAVSGRPAPGGQGDLGRRGAADEGVASGLRWPSRKWIFRSV